jgi:hypothetical protein
LMMMKEVEEAEVVVIEIVKEYCYYLHYQY